ncbi:MAG TPA: site-specific integrase, partial [Kofleriaceae bacterium]|nr:site-specific integrase [Kofleriaceae bacterium]
MAPIRRDKGSGERPLWLASERRWRARYIDALGARRAVYSSTPGRAGAREAAARRDKALRKAGLGVVDDPRLTVGQLLERWLAEVAAVRLRPRSHERYAGIVRSYLVPVLGRLRLNDLTEQHIATLYAEMAKPRRVTIAHARSTRTVDRALSPATRRYVHAVLHGALAQAVAWRLIERNPAAGASLPRASSPEMRPLRPAEARRFLAAAEGHPLEALFVLAVTTGMRQGELLALRWRDIDWSARRVAVRHTLVRLAGRWWLDDPKTASSQRAVDLTPPTIDLLRAQRARNAERMLAVGHALTDDDLVFCDDAGQPLWGRHVTTRQLKPLLRNAGLPPIRFHDLRHTFATLQLAAGTNPKIVSEVLGHKEVAITLDRYSHALPTLQAKAMARLDTVLGRAPRRRLARGTDAADAGGSPRDKGPDKGPNRRAAGAKEPDLNSDRAENE